MQNSLAELSKKAIDASLKGLWKEAVDYNSQILEKDPKSLDAKIRLGRALIQLSDFSKAKKIFKEVLEVDPINEIALKNLKLAGEHKLERTTNVPIDPKSLIKEPGTTSEVSLEIMSKKHSAEDFVPGEALNIKLTKKEVEFYKVDNKGEEFLVSKTNSKLFLKLKYVEKEEGTCEATFISGEGKSMIALVKCSEPVFRSEKQEVKPYIKRGSLDEPDMELPAEAEIEE